MRRSVTTDIEALVCIGGKAVGYRGRMPGVFEEVMVALSQQVPVYLLGGLGGATWFIAEQIRDEPRDELTLRGQLVGQLQQSDLALAEGKPPLPDYRGVDRPARPHCSSRKLRGIPTSAQRRMGRASQWTHRR